jgi:hypothetical protein
MFSLKSATRTSRERFIENLIVAGGRLRTIFGPPGPVNRKHLWKSIEVTADAPDYLDHFIQIVAPLAINLSHIPTE